MVIEKIISLKNVGKEAVVRLRGGVNVLISDVSEICDNFIVLSNGIAVWNEEIKSVEEENV